MSDLSKSERQLWALSRRWSPFFKAVINSKLGLIAGRNMPLESPVPAFWRVIVCGVDACRVSRNFIPEYLNIHRLGI